MISSFKVANDLGDDVFAQLQIVQEILNPNKPSSLFSIQIDDTAVGGHNRLLDFGLNPTIPLPIEYNFDFNAIFQVIDSGSVLANGLQLGGVVDPSQDPGNGNAIIHGYCGVDGVVTNSANRITATSNQIMFGATNTAPASTVAPTKWISVQVKGEATAYRIPLYQ
jgi:hypothetical protein